MTDASVLRSQYRPIISSLDFTHHFEVQPLAHLPPSHLFVSTRDTSFACATGQIFYLTYLAGNSKSSQKYSER